MRDGLYIPECHGPQEVLRKGRGKGRARPSGLVHPFGTRGSLAGVDVHRLLAVLALHRAAPLELALALGDALHARGVVAPPTAHDLTAVRPARRLVAHSPGSAQGTCSFVHEAVIRRILKVHQFVLSGLPEALVADCEACAVLVHGDLDGSVVLLAEVVSGLPEVGHGQPTSPKRAGATDPMTFTL